MGLFGKSKKEREKEYMSKLDVPSCLKENFELIIDDAFTIMGCASQMQNDNTEQIEENIQDCRKCQKQKRFRRTSCVDTCHNVNCTKFADLTFFKAFQFRFGFFFK